MLFTCILHTKAAVDVMAALIYKPNIISDIKGGSLLHKTGIPFF